MNETYIVRWAAYSAAMANVVIYDSEKMCYDDAIVMRNERISCPWVHQAWIESRNA